MTLFETTAGIINLDNVLVIKPLETLYIGMNSEDKEIDPTKTAFVFNGYSLIIDESYQSIATRLTTTF